MKLAEDLERLKLGHLFHTLFPKEAAPFERTEKFFALPFEWRRARNDLK